MGVFYVWWVWSKNFARASARTFFSPPLTQPPQFQNRVYAPVQAFIVINRHVSFYNHGLLKHITDNHDLCSDDDRKQMMDYCHKFGQFCQRKVFEVPSGTFKQGTAKSK